jgi:uncharacterized membrane protein YbaN (DUF454 family)
MELQKGVVGVFFSKLEENNFKVVGVFCIEKNNKVLKRSLLQAVIIHPGFLCLD